MSTLNKVSRHRAPLRAEGLRLFQMWVPDTRAAKFAEHVRRQVRKLQDDPDEREILVLTDEAARSTDGWV